MIGTETAPTSANPFDLRRHVAVITGGNSGIGLAMADALAAAGAGVCVWGTNEERNTAAAEKLRPHDTKILALSWDVSDEQQVEQAMQRTTDHFGRLDSCFANASAGGTENRSLETELSEFRRVTPGQRRRCVPDPARRRTTARRAGRGRQPGRNREPRSGAGPLPVLLTRVHS